MPFGTIISNSTTAAVNTPSVQNFWAFCVERENIRLRKELGNPPPWTEDKILQEYHFCNIKREYDYGTRWYLNWVAVAPDKLDLLWKTILYRTVNNVAWFEQIGGVFGWQEWKSMSGDIVDYIEHAPPPYTPAHITLQSPDGKTRREHLYEQLYWLSEGLEDLAAQVYGASSLKAVWEHLKNVPYVGPFIALQIFRDLLLAKALPFSEDDFTYLGPGCRQGLLMIFPDIKNYRQQYAVLQEIQRLHPEELELNLGDMEHSMCEARKYWKLSQGGGRHRHYQPHLAPIGALAAVGSSTPSGALEASQ